MNNRFQILPFSQAYDAYYKAIDRAVFSGCNMLEVGGGAHPSIVDRSDYNYTIVDPDESELAKSPADVEKTLNAIQDVSTAKRYDLIISKMVLEHVPDPDGFHSAVLRLLQPGGMAIHFFACRTSVPALVNRWLPEWAGEGMLRLIRNRNTNDQPKYKAYYRRTVGPLRKQIKYFEELGFTVERYEGFVGHSYLRKVPILNYLEAIYTRLLTRLKAKHFSTVSLLVLRK